MIWIDDSNVPIELNTLAIMTTNRILRILFFSIVLTDLTSSPMFCMSLTVGFDKNAWTIPANQPAARKGLRELIGAIKKAVNMVKGWARTNAVPSADKVPLMSIQS